MFGFFGNMFGGGNNEEVKNAIKEGAFLVDVRTPGEFAMGTALGAVNIPLEALHNHMNDFEGKSSIVFFCRSGARSGNARSILASQGYENVHNGGTWQQVDRMVREVKAEQ